MLLKKITPLCDSILNKLGVPVGVGIDTYCVDNFIKKHSQFLKKTDKVLDAGAGSCPYKKYFNPNQYNSTDVSDERSEHTFLCSLEKIPVPDNTYDMVVCTQVLEHVPYPQKVIDEFYRILKLDGKLLLTAPLGWMVHGEPYHFFNFTCYGLELLFKNSGFTVISIDAKGGIFWYISDLIKDLPIPIVKHFIQVYLFFLDKFDKKQRCTLGYNCYVVKKSDKNVFCVINKNGYRWFV